MSNDTANDHSPRIAALLRTVVGGKLGVCIAGFVVTLLMAVLFLSRPDWLTQQDLKLYDELAKRHHPLHHGDAPVVVDIDEKSLAAYGQWPWPRYRIALLLAKLRDCGIRAVGLDILLAEPDRTSPRVITEQLRRDLKVEAAITGLPEALRDYDQTLANVLREGPFILGYYFAFDRADATPVHPAAACPLPPLHVTTLGSKGSMALADCLARGDHPVCPLPRLLAAAPGAGFFNIVPDADGILRRCPLLVSHDRKVYPSLALATVMQAYGADNVVVRATSGGVTSLTLRLEGLGERTVPLDASGMLLVNYRGPGGFFPRVSAADILAGTADAPALTGKIAFVGTSAAGLGDLRASPLDQAMPGVEVHATVADMLLDGDFLYRPDWALGAELLSLVTVGVLSSALLAMAGALTLIVPFAALGAGAWYGAALCLRQGMYLSPLGALLVLAANFTVLTFLKFWREERQKRFLHGAFAHYVSPSLVSRIVSGRHALTLSGEEREVTVLFSDVRGFTSLSENLAPNQVADLLQRYFTPMTHIIIKHMGTLDKFIGDAIMAFWNAPLDVPHHQRQALRAAMAMQAELARLNDQFRTLFGLTLKAGIGLHCGVVRVGNFGSKDLFDYTVIGDAVNLCSRLEGLTKYYGVKLLVTDSLMDGDDSEFVFQEIDRVRVMGKKQPITLFTVHAAAEFSAREAELTLAAKARTLYVARRFPEASMAYDALAAQYDRKLYALFGQRSRAMAASPPPGDWDGVYEHQSK